MSENHFLRLSQINVNDKTERKGSLTYLSWAWAVDRLLREDGTATWSYGEPQRWGDTVMVFCTVTAFGKSMTAQLPVMDNRNKAIVNPTAFDVNTAMQRCLAKAISLHGIGLYIYAGEDLPNADGEDSQPVQPSRTNEERDIERQIQAAGTFLKGIGFNKDEYNAFRTMHGEPWVTVALDAKEKGLKKEDLLPQEAKAA